jgi:hypothetical protein
MICTVMEAAKVMPNRLAWQGHIKNFSAEGVKHFYVPETHIMYFIRRC